MKIVLRLLFRAAALCGLVTASSAQTNSPWQERADRFLSLANAGYQALYRVQSIAQWNAATDVTPAHDAASDTAGQAIAAFTGNPALINEAKDLLQHRGQLQPLTVRQLDRVILNAAEGPMTNPNWLPTVSRPKRSRPPP